MKRSSLSPLSVLHQKSKKTYDATNQSLDALELELKQEYADMHKRTKWENAKLVFKRLIAGTAVVGTALYGSVDLFRKSDFCLRNVEKKNGKLTDQEFTSLYIDFYVRMLPGINLKQKEKNKLEPYIRNFVGRMNLWDATARARRRTADGGKHKSTQKRTKSNEDIPDEVNAQLVAEVFNTPLQNTRTRRNSTSNITSKIAHITNAGRSNDTPQTMTGLVARIDRFISQNIRRSSRNRKPSRKVKEAAENDK